MNKQQTEGKLAQLKGSIKQTWGKLTDNDIMLADGQLDKFYGRIKEEHGDEREVAEKKLDQLKKDAAASGTRAA